MAQDTDKPTCGRCGVYRHLHPHKRCKRSRRSYWLDEHSPWRHPAGNLWLALPEKWRWDIVARLHKRRPHLCWCDFVNAAYLDASKDDYRGSNGCGCHVPLPTDAGAPRPGWCYCAPTDVDVAGVSR